MATRYDDPNLQRTLARIQSAATGTRRFLQRDPAAGRPQFNPTISDLARAGALRNTTAPATKLQRPDTIAANGFDGTTRPRPAPAGTATPAASAPAAQAGAQPSSALSTVKPLFEATPAQIAADGGLARPPGPQADPGKLYRTGANGEHIYSDGTGGIHATMTRQQAQTGDLGGDVTVVPASAFSRPLLSDVTGNANSSTADGVAMRMAALRRQQPVTGSRPSPEAFAEADRMAALNRDPRSAYGVAARGVDVRSGSDNSRTGRRIAAQQVADLMAGPQTAAAGVGGRLAGQQTDAAALRRTQLQNQNAIDLAQQNALARPLQPVTLGDGTLGAFNQTTGTVQRATLPNGETVQGGTDDARKRTQTIIDQLNSNATKQLQALAGLGQDVTPEQITQIRVQNALAMGLQPQVNPQTGQAVALINGQWMPL